MIVDCYFNSREKCFSVRYKGKVIGHSNTIYLRRAKFIVSEKSRQRVLSTKHKNVHAIVRGELSEPVFVEFQEGYYNPYETDGFVDKKTGQPLLSADVVLLTNLKIYYKE